MKDFAKLRSVLLLDSGWAVMVKVLQDFIDGVRDPGVALGYCDHLGVGPNESRTYMNAEGLDPLKVVFEREGGRSNAFIAGLDGPLRALGALTGDLAFVSFKSGIYTLLLRRWADQPGDDALGQLLWSSGLDHADYQLRRDPWRRLARVFGGVGATREAVHQLLKFRGDKVRLRLLDEAVVEPGLRSEWRPDWRYTAKPLMLAGRLLALDNGAEMRVAVGSGAPRPGATSAFQLMRSRDGLLWWECIGAGSRDDAETRGDHVVRSCVPSDRILSAEWVRWVIAEQRARRRSLCQLKTMEWHIDVQRIARSHDCASMLLEALENIADVHGVEPVRLLLPETTTYPLTASGFRMACSRAVRSGLTDLRSDGTLGFLAEYQFGSPRKGVNLVDVLA